MGLLNRHDDALLEDLAAGTLPDRKRQRALSHVRECERCARRYEQLVAAHRALAGKPAHEPSPQELATLRSANLRAALAAATPARAARPRVLGWVSALAGGAAAVAIAIVLVRPGADEWRARGQPGQGQAVLRVFCVRQGQAPAELESAGRCPPGASLAFAVGAVPPLRHARVSVGGRSVGGALAVEGTPGQERPLPLVVPLEGAGAREVTVTFEEGPVVLRHEVRVEPDP